MYLQEIFTVTFSIMYGIMLNSLLGWNLFHFGSLCVKNGEEKVGRRILFSLIFINFFPILSFAIIFQCLSSYDSTIWNIVGVFIMSFVVFGFYRLIPFMVLLGKKYPWLQLYDELLYKKNKLTCEELEQLKEKSLEGMDKQFIRIGDSLFGHFFSIVFYMFFLPFLGYIIIILNN
ncbi:hypothetical protein ES703_14575 [subsurface metagenome]